LPTIIVPSYAKLNLFLRVAGLRPDGYHEIETVFERISLCDTITFSSTKESSIRIHCRAPGIPRDERNLCYKAAQALKDRFKVARGCEIRLTKRVPAGSGMGGGSSNAAATLAGLCRLWRLRCSTRGLAQIAASIGSDVAFFVYDTEFARGSGRGERIRPFAGRGPILHHVILVPPVHVSTKEIYEKWDMCAPGPSGRPGTASVRRLTTSSRDATIITRALKKQDLDALCGALSNDLERVTENAYPAIRDAKQLLSRQPGARGALMTGSGAAVFGIFESKQTAAACCRRLSGGNSRVFYARTC
jgi:4-diphosphocytidyl-2-C-methyl-D-erythritol kinase